MEDSFKELVQYYGEDPKSTTPESFFMVFWNFAQNLDVSISLVL